MSNLLNFALRQGTNVLRTQCFRVVSRSTTQVLVRNPVNKPINFLIDNIHNTTRKQSFSTRPYDIDTNIAKDVILFKYENPKFYNILNIFAVCQFVFWVYLSHFAFTTLKDAPVKENPDVELQWYQRINLGENKYRNGIAICCFTIGYGILFAAWMFTLRSVRFLILRKGGKEVSLVTYGPFNKNRITTVPLNCISAQESRELSSTLLPLKIKNKTLFYVLDMRGEFRNPRLFDYTAGLKRRI